MVMMLFDLKSLPHIDVVHKHPKLVLPFGLLSAPYMFTKRVAC